MKSSESMCTFKEFTLELYLFQNEQRAGNNIKFLKPWIYLRHFFKLTSFYNVQKMVMFYENHEYISEIFTRIIV